MSLSTKYVTVGPDRTSNITEVLIKSFDQHIFKQLFIDT